MEPNPPNTAWATNLGESCSTTITPIPSCSLIIGGCPSGGGRKPHPRDWVTTAIVSPSGDHATERNDSQGRSWLSHHRTSTSDTLDSPATVAVYTDDICEGNWCRNRCNAQNLCAPTSVRPPDSARKNRYISFDRNNNGVVAFQAEMTASEYFENSTGVLGWVGEPDENGISRVIDTPYFSDGWPNVIHVGYCPIVPVATYEIRATDDQTPPYTFSEAHQVATIAQPSPKYWGDCVGEISGGHWTYPNGLVNMNDVLSAVQKFQELDTAPPLTWVDVDPEVPDGDVDMADINQIVSAFQANEYPFSDPAECGGRDGGGAGGGPNEAAVAFSLVADPEVISPGESVDVEVYVGTVSDLVTYQVTLEVTGGDAGGLELDGLLVDTGRDDYVFGAAEVLAAEDLGGGRLGAVCLDGGRNIVGPAYVGTFSYRASSDAAGSFDVCVRGGEDSFLLDSEGEIIPSSPGDGARIECQTE